VARPSLTARGQLLRVALALPALVGIFLLGQAVLDARAWRLDLSPDQRYTLSEHAETVLAELPADVRILAFLRSQDPRNPLIRDMLRRVQASSPRVRVDEVDVNRSPALAREYGVEAYGALVVESGGRRRVFSNPREEILVAALLQVTRQQRKTVGWVLGHGEGDLASSARFEGYSTARVLLEQEYYDVQPISLLGDEVPLGTSVLLIVGPQKDFLPNELAALERYLKRPGALFVLLDPREAPNLAELLDDYGLVLADDIVIDPEARLYGGEHLTMRLTLERGLHPLLGPLAAPPLFSLSRSVELAGHLPEGASGTMILESGGESWATTDPTVLRTGSGRFAAGRDRRGPIGLGAEIALRLPAPRGAPAPLARIVAYGNAEFANNFFIEYLGNGDLFLNTVAWLARDPQGIARRSLRQVPGINQFYVSSEEGNALFWGAAVAIPLAFGVVGIVLAVRRRWGA
jgi:ABC-type uncharacterized transport system involved in gliding motility auxiliary subunit